ncbi:MAG TPA: helix-turn-helix domain-containing protein [Dehalococcoidia bacterium]|nr:helix-turn-helix domain-containing protein [Dehalococcoidia bacterium]
MASPVQTQIEFAASVPLDLINAMYFTSLADSHEGLDEWPVRTRERMDPALRAELDLLFSCPRNEPGVMGALNDTLFFHRDASADVEGLLRFVRELPAEGTPDPRRPGIQGLALYALRWPGHNEPYLLDDGVSPHAAMAAALAEEPPLGDLACTPPREGECEPKAMLALFDEPEDVRARMLHLIRRFYDEHYRPDEARRVSCMRRSAEAHERDRGGEVHEVTRRLLGRNTSCLDTVCTGNYRSYIFVPSVDVGIYNSCIDYEPLHALYYPCEPQYRGMPDEDEDTRRMALVYRALSDEQRLRILRLLRDGELYAQEIVERTGLHQSVVSRHLSFMKAVGLVNVRRQNNMKFYSLNEEAGNELRGALALLVPASAARSGYRSAVNAP